MRANILFAELTSDFGGELVVGGGPFREPPTVMQSTVSRRHPAFSLLSRLTKCIYLTIYTNNVYTERQEANIIYRNIYSAIRRAVG